MKNLKVLLMAIICLGLLLACVKLFAEEETVNRAVIRIEQSSAQRAEGAEEAWQSYEARLSEYNNLLLGRKVVLEEYKPVSRGTTTVSSGYSSVDSAISNTGDSGLLPASKPVVRSKDEAPVTLDGAPVTLAQPKFHRPGITATAVIMRLIDAADRLYGSR